MVGKDFEVGDLVWAKMKSYPPWPSKISDPSEAAKPTSGKKGHHFVYFFGTKDFAWLPDENIFPHSDQMIQQAPQKKSSSFKRAIEEIISESEKQPPKKYVPKHDTDKASSDAFDNLRKKVVKKKESPQKRKMSEKKFSKKRPAEMNGGHYISSFNAGHGSCLEDSGSPFKKKRDFSMTDKSIVKGIVEFPPTLPFNSIQCPEYIERPVTPPINIEEITPILVGKNIKATDKKIGFLGLGALGRGIVKNLMNSGHKVTVWNRLPDACQPFIAAGARVATTPSDVVEACDIIFSCVADPNAAKVVVFGKYGVLKGLEGSTPSTKGYIELSGIDAETSQEIGREICTKGGRYIAAPVSGSRSLAEDGQLLVLVAGDFELFQHCESCFSAFSKYTYFISLEVGKACNLSLVLSMFKGSVIAALAEALTLVKCSDLPRESFMSFLNMGFISHMLQGKGEAMIQKNYRREVKLEHQQKDLGLALTLASNLNQPLMIGSGANEIYKRVKQYYADHDVSVVIEGIRPRGRS